jgi:hypothetical protein
MIKNRSKFALGNVTFANDPNSSALRVHSVSIARTDTAGKLVATLPANSIIDAIFVTSAVGGQSNAGTSATISVGKTLTGVDYVNALDVKGSTGAGFQAPAGVTGSYGSVGSASQTVYGSYAETGTASSSGGPWTITVLSHQ